MDFNYLSLIVFLPVAGAIIIALVPGLSARLMRYIAAVFTFIPLAIAFGLFIAFDRSDAMAGVVQFEELATWIAPLNAHYHLGVDGLSMPLVLLTAMLGFLVVLISWKVELRLKEYLAWLERKDKGVPVNEALQNDIRALVKELGLTGYNFPFL